MTVLSKYGTAEEDDEVICGECEAIFVVIFHRSAIHDGIEYCPFCGDAIEAFEGFGS